MATKRKQKRRTPKKVETKSANWGQEFFAVTFVALGVFIALALGSYLNVINTEQPLWSEGAAPNMMGHVGAKIADAMVFMLGWCSFITVLWAFAVARFVWISGGESKPLSFGSFIRTVLGATIFLTCFAALFSVMFSNEGGGILGGLLADVLVREVNSPGAILLCITGIILALGFGTGIGISQIFSFVKSLFIAAKRVVFAVFRLGKVFKAKDYLLAKISLVAVVSFFSFIGRTFKSFFGAFSGLFKRVPEIPKPVLAAPKISKKPVLLTQVVADEPRIVLRRQADKKSKVPSKQIENYQLPGLDLLQPSVKREDVGVSKQELLDNSKTLERTLEEFKVEGNIVEVHPGPVVTQYEFSPSAGVKAQRVISLSDDLALALKVPSVRVYAPVPGKGTVGIEVPNKVREVVRLRDIVETNDFVHSEHPLPLALGKDTYGESFVACLPTMPHLLIAGATGTGKSVCINSILLSLLFHNSPKDLRLILIDPKMLELSLYDGIPHLKAPVVTEPKRARVALWWAVEEMERRYSLMKSTGVRSLESYNKTEGVEYLPRLVIVVDELADLMLTVGREIEELLTRLAQKARACGIHLILATQRPSVNVITGLIKANFPTRISFQVASRIDARTVLDRSGSEKLLGRGDMMFLAPGVNRIKRIQGAFVSDKEVHSVVDFLRGNSEADYDKEIMELMEKSSDSSVDTSGMYGGMEDYDPLYDKAVQVVTERGQASTSMVQRVFKIGYNRAARIMETMELEGIVGPADGAKPRQILVPTESADAG